MVFSVILIALAIRMFFLQVYPAKQVLNNYTNQQVEMVSDTNFKVYDRNLNDLCEYFEKYIVVIDKKSFSLNNYEDTLEELIAFNFIMKNEISDFNFADIMKNQGKTYFEVSRETYDKINKLKDLKGVYEYKQNSIEKKDAWSIANMFQSITDNDDYVSGSLQYKVHDIIKDNQNIYKNFYINDDAKYIGSEDITPSENKNIALTVDKTIQDRIKSVLNKDEYKNIENIGVILMESESGKIDAMLQKDESKANINLAIDDSGYEPGSIFKVITLASALEDGKITMNDQFVCTGKICKDGPHGRLSVNNAFIKSCNDIFADIGSKETYDRIMYYAKQCGLYDRVLGMQGETLGSMPKIEDGINNISIGQCSIASPLQMIGAINTVVNNGVYVKPYIIDKVIDKDNNTALQFNPEKKNVFSKTTAMQIKQSMKEVVLYGTGKKAYIEGMNIGGKTGSATSGNGESTHCWFVGYYEVNNKTYTMIVCVPDMKDVKNENIGGGDICAPIFKEIVNSINIK